MAREPGRPLTCSMTSALRDQSGWPVEARCASRAQRQLAGLPEKIDPAAAEFITGPAPVAGNWLLYRLIASWSLRGSREHARENARRPDVLVGGPIAKHGSPIAPELGDMGR